MLCCETHRQYQTISLFDFERLDFYSSIMSSDFKVHANDNAPIAEQQDVTNAVRFGSNNGCLKLINA